MTPNLKLVSFLQDDQESQTHDTLTERSDAVKSRFEQMQKAIDSYREYKNENSYVMNSARKSESSSCTSSPKFSIHK
jgi:hypothetical protein